MSPSFGAVTVHYSKAKTLVKRAKAIIPFLIILIKQVFSTMVFRNFLAYFIVLLSGTLFLASKSY